MFYCRAAALPSTPARPLCRQPPVTCRIQPWACASPYLVLSRTCVGYSSHPAWVGLPCAIGAGTSGIRSKEEEAVQHKPMLREQAGCSLQAGLALLHMGCVVWWSRTARLVVLKGQLFMVKDYLTVFTLKYFMAFLFSSSSKTEELQADKQPQFKELSWRALITESTSAACQLLSLSVRGL